MAVSLVILLGSCGGNKSVQNIGDNRKSHQWFYFSDQAVESVDFPRNVPQRLLKPWTEQVRISSAMSNPGKKESYAVVNRLGILKFTGEGFSLVRDPFMFGKDSADGLVYSAGRPVFYLYRSTFFNDSLLKASPVEPQDSMEVINTRNFLVSLDPGSSVMLPLVSYGNLNLKNEDQITGYFWDGKTWVCSTKTARNGENTVRFSYFKWEPVLALTEMSPALTPDFFTFSSCSEGEYRRLNSPKEFSRAPAEVKELVKPVGSKIPFYLKWNDGSGTSPVSYFQEGNGTVPINAVGESKNCSGVSCVIFQDGTTYLKGILEGRETDLAFRLPKLPQGFAYGDFVLCGTRLYVAWEESAFFKTGRSGFIQVNLQELY